MAFPLGQNELSTLRTTAHWHCDLYKVTRLGGGIPLRISTLDRNIEHGGEIYVPTAGERYDEELAASLASGDTELIGALSPQTITQVDVQRGYYDDARIDQYRIDWRRPQKRPYLHQVWYVDEMSHNGRVWRATLSSSARFMQSQLGDIYNSTCPAVLGDSRCKATVLEYSEDVSSVQDVQFEFNYAGLSVPTGWFTLGSVTWVTGNNKGTTSRVLTHTSAGAIVLSVPTRFHISVSDDFVARQGCDGLATTCKNKFNNLLNYRGNERQRNAKQLILSRGQVGN